MDQYISLTPNRNDTFYQKNKWLFKFFTQEKLTKTDLSLFSKLENCEPFLYGLIYISSFQNTENVNFEDWFIYCKSAVKMLATATGYTVNNDIELNTISLALALNCYNSSSKALSQSDVLFTNVLDESKKISYRSNVCVWARYMLASIIAETFDTDEAIQNNIHLFIESMTVVSQLKDDFDKIISQYPSAIKKRGFKERVREKES